MMNDPQQSEIELAQNDAPDADRGGHIVDEHISLFETPKGIRIIEEFPSLRTTNETMLAEEDDPEDLSPWLTERLLEGFDPEAGVRRAGSSEHAEASTQLPPGIRARTRVVTRSSGAHFVYALIALTVTLGALGLSLSWRDPQILAACAVIVPLSLTWFLLRFRAWLNHTPYVYRLMTSLGENAENLRGMRLLTLLRRAIRAG